MNNLLRVRVEVVAANPTRGNPPKVLRPDFGYGIQNKEQAEAWARRKGYKTVYWWKSCQRVYAELPQARVDERAKVIESQSRDLRTLAERPTYKNADLDA